MRYNQHGPITLDELMCTALSREVRDGDLVAVGVGTPMAVIAAMLARETHAPNIAMTYCGTVTPDTHDVVLGMIDQAMLGRKCSGFIPHLETLDLCERGGMALEFMGPAQVDGEGNMNTSFIPRPGKPPIHLPGGLATGDVALLMGRLVIYKGEHSPRVFPAKVDYVTGAGHVRGAAARERMLPCRQGPVAIITNLAVIRFVPGGDSRLESVHPGVTPEQVVAATGFRLQVLDRVPVTAPPTAEQLKLLRQVIDPYGVRRLDLKETRQDALDMLQHLREQHGHRE